MLIKEVSIILAQIVVRGFLVISVVVSDKNGSVCRVLTNNKKIVTAPTQKLYLELKTHHSAHRTTKY